MYCDDEGTSDPLILLDGATGTNDITWTALRPLPSGRCRTLHIEHRAHGRTNNPAGYLSFDLLASDIIAFIKHLLLASAHTAGFSDGGIIAPAVALPADLAASIDS
jgi:pimeloyl-ACP methyl ester carboxylesterase